MPVALGHNRLAIIDLSEDGNQPMHYDDYVLIFNGEIYNYIEIKEELIKKGYRFNTTSDSEVILASYKEYGDSCVNYFVGISVCNIHQVVGQTLRFTRQVWH